MMIEQPTMQETAKPKRGMMEPYAAAVRLQRDFRCLATRMARRDEFLADDLVQEMSLTVLRCRCGHTGKFYLELARRAALYFLRREKWHSKQENVDDHAETLFAPEVDFDALVEDEGKEQQTKQATPADAIKALLAPRTSVFFNIAGGGFR